MKKVIKILICCVITLCSFMSFPIHIEARAEEVTGVMEDLKSHPEFNESNYPFSANDYSLQVITIAESFNKGLYIYVYQPSQNMKATSINMSTAVRKEDLKYVNYKLALVSESEMFFKYLVVDYVISSDETMKRFYEISTIFRKFDNDIDTEENLFTENSTNEIAYPVGKKYELATIGGEIVMACEDIELITVTNKFVGFVRYPENGINVSGFVGESSTDCHFVAFSTDKLMENLLEADVYFEKRLRKDGYNKVFGVNIWEGPELAEEVESGYVSLKKEDYLEVSNKGRYWGIQLYGEQYKFYRIEKSSEFIEETEDKQVYSFPGIDVTVEVKLNEEVKNAISSTDWVLRFLETPYDVTTNSTEFVIQRYIDSYMVGNVSILRLAFETEGKYYNLGVVDNKTTGSTNPGNTIVTKTELALPGLKDFKELLGIILGLIALALLAPIIPLVLKVIINIFKLIFKLLTLPFWIFKRW